MAKKPKAIDLFCGAGGLTEGLRQAGYSVVGAVELEPLACEAYKLNHPRVKLWRSDIRMLAESTVYRALKIRKGELDLLAACPPCQGFSTMRTKNGKKGNRDVRNDLIFEVLRFVRALRPKTIMLENVPGLAESQRFAEFKKEIRALHYKIRHGILNTVDYGVPQRRRRLIMLASRFGRPEFPPAEKVRKTVRQSLGGLPSPTRSTDPLHNYPVRRSRKIRELIRRIPKNGGSRLALGIRDQLPCHMKVDGFNDVYGRMAWDRPSPTITGGCINPSKGRFLHPESNRAITLREAALLQTFPLTYRFPLTRGRFPAALLIGNALPPEFIKRHAISLREAVLQSVRQ
jgi:DNA (cytosine-5)-methyltransferase 1